MTTSGVATSCSECGVDDPDVDVAVQLDDYDGPGVEQVPVEGQPGVALPPDGGWGWAVVGAAFLSNLIVGGVCYMFGIIMPELLDHFQAGQGKTAFVGSLVPGTLSVVGKPVSCCLTHHVHASPSR